MRGLAVRARHTPGSMNRLELRYSGLLEGRVRDGEIAGWRFEPMKLRLAKSCFYDPDFMVTLANGEMEFHEVKGFWEDDARVKVKVAAESFHQFRFIGVTFDKRRGWMYEQFN